jgi:serine/threonine protein kinase
MGEVYRARDTRLDRMVAIKVLPSHPSSDPELKQRLEREAKAISALQHANICTLYDIGTQGGTDFLVMEFLEGETLANRLQKGPVPVDQVLKIGTEIVQALAKAHQQGIIHRDLKPANIMLTKAGAKLMDFGLAKPKLAIASQAAAPFTPSTPTVNLASLTSAASPLTQKGSIVGTFQYMAPEVLQGAEADARSDLFSFGCVLYEMVTGHRAFLGKSQLSVLTAILEKEPEPVTVTRPLTPPMLDRVIRACLAKDPLDRIADCARCRDELAVGGGYCTWRYCKITPTTQQGPDGWSRRALACLGRGRRFHWLSLGTIFQPTGVVACRNPASGEISVRRHRRCGWDARTLSAGRQAGVCGSLRRLQAALGSFPEQ